MPISDKELHNIVQEIRKTTPNFGERRLISGLRSRKIHIQSCRVRDSLSMLIWLEQRYDGGHSYMEESTQFPAQMPYWTLTGTTSWYVIGLLFIAVLTGFLDHSFMFTVLTITKVRLFQNNLKKALQRMVCLPMSKVTMGWKNFGIAAYMLKHRGLRKGSIITKTSVCNCRAERVHKDVYPGVLPFFNSIF